MASLIPETVTRLQATAFVQDAELNNVGRDRIIRSAAERMAESALRKILQDCIRAKEYMGYKGQTLHLDVYVLSQNELLEIVARAREQGEKDALKWTDRAYSIGE